MVCIPEFSSCYWRPPLALPGRELFRVGCTGIYLKPFGMRLLAAAASELVMRQFLSTCSVHACQDPETQPGHQKPLTPMSLNRTINTGRKHLLLCGASVVARKVPPEMPLCPKRLKSYSPARQSFSGCASASPGCSQALCLQLHQSPLPLLHSSWLSCPTHARESPQAPTQDM